MIEVKGKYNYAKIFNDNVEPKAMSEIINLCNQEFLKDCKIRIMPGVYMRENCVIGFTGDLGDKVIPNIVGADIGCGILTVALGKTDINLELVDNIIRKYIPTGANIHERRIARYSKLRELYCYRSIKDKRGIQKSIGTLGKGNHFIELDKDNRDNLYLVIHSGSGNLGNQITGYYQKLAVDACSGKDAYFIARDKIIFEYKNQGKEQLIQKALGELKKKYVAVMPKYPKELCFLTGDFREHYLHDMNICKEYAALNRSTIAEIILEKALNKKLHDFKSFSTIHNYINLNDNVIRKGSISAYKCEQVLIPINMRDGSLICEGRGNEDWNYSAPHGSGSMTHKLIEEIIEDIKDSVKVIKVIKPVYNFKAES